MSKALRAPLTMNDIPMRLAAWTYKEAGGARVRLLMTAEIERAADAVTRLHRRIRLDRSQQQGALRLKSSEARCDASRERSERRRVYRQRS